MKETKKVFSLLLSVMMMFSIIMVPAHAEGTDEPEEGTGQGWRKWVEQLEGEPEEAMTVIPGTEPAPAPAPVYEAGSLEAESSNYKVVVTYGEEAQIPAGTVATVTEYAEGSAEYEAAKETLLQEKSEDDFAGFVAFDISLYNGDELVEPQSPVDVTVSVNLNALPEEAVEAADTLELQHHDETTGTAVLDVIATAEEIEVGNEDATVNFAVESFSTFTITWGNNTGNRVTVHYGIMQSGRFVEFGTNNLPNSANTRNFPSSTLRTSNYGWGDSAYLIYDFSGYKYTGTYITSNNNESSNPTTLTAIEPRIYAYGDYGWYRGGNQQIQAGRHIYVVYEAKEASPGYMPSSDDPDDPDDPTPEYVPDVGKVVSEMKGDGTYDITLSVVGHEDSSEKVVKARVIVVFDVSGSMAWGMGGQGSGGTSRLQLAKNAVNKMAQTLLAKEDSQHNKLVELGLVTFSNDATKRQFNGNDYTSDYNTYSSMINSLGANGGTNWEAALDLANSMKASENSKTYIIFVSDGNPTFRTSRDDLTDAQVANDGYNYNNGNVRFGSGQTGSSTETPCYNTAVIAAKSIVEHKKDLHTVGLSNDASKLINLASAAGGVYHDGSDENKFAQAMENIASAITSEIGLTDVEIVDGVTSMSEIQTEALIGTADNYVFKITDPEGNEVPWDNPPEPTVNENNSLSWNLAGTKLQNEYTYSVTFTVWPKQEAYDLIADLNNELEKIANLDAGVKYQLRVLVNGTTYEFDPVTNTWTNGLSDAQLQALIDANSAVYSMKTNTGLSASYKYGGIDGSHEYTNYTNGNMTLETETFGIKKIWNNVLPQDSRTAQWLVDEDGNYVYDEDGNHVMYIDLIVQKENEYYEEVRLLSTDDWKIDNIFISLGVISVSGDTLIIREPGHEYTVTEKPSDAYYWELDAQTYRPMFINGHTTMLVKVEEDDTDYDSVKDMADKTKRTVGTTDYYRFEGGIYKAIADEGAMLQAVNHRRSYLNLTKAVEETNAPADALFEYKVTIDNPLALHPGDEGYNAKDTDGYWFSIFAPEIGDEGETLNPSNYEGWSELVSGATAEEGEDGYTGYLYADNGAEVTIKIKAGWNVRFINLMSTTKYSIEETENMDPGFIFDSIEATAESGDGDDAVPATVDADNKMLVNGIIDYPNTDYTVKYTNKYLGVFYVYHSSNNTVERFNLAENGKQLTSFDIYAKTAEGTLYGGYYSTYAGADPDETWETSWGEETIYTDTTENAKAYDYQYIKDSGKAAWTYADGYSEIGTAMTPVADTTYYLKEVPAAYLLPYTHYTYYKSGLKVANLWAITAIDDMCYSDVGFVVQVDDKDATIVSSLTIKAANSTSTVTLTPNKVYKAKGILDGYLGYVEITDYKQTDPNAKTTIKQYWTTKDGITVKGLKKRELTFQNDTITGLKYKDVDLEEGD